MAETSTFESPPMGLGSGVSSFECTVLDNINSRDSGLGLIKLSKGLNQEMVNSLVERTNDLNDLELHKNTSDLKRFGSEERYLKWLKKGRTVFALSGENDEILALIWFGRKNPPYLTNSDDKIWHTVAFRAYGSFRNRHLMKPLSQQVFDIYEEGLSEEELKNMRYWLGVHPENNAGINLYNSLGFKYLGTSKEAKRNTMVK